ncbi:redoxin family protein [bacterium]|nr:redoxin family protein [bacterium]
MSMAHRKTLFLFAFAALYLALSCGRYERQYDGDPIAADDAGTVEFEADEADEGCDLAEDALPNFTWPDHRGQTVRLHDFCGRAVMVSVGAGWCVPCREEAPLYERDLWDVYKDEGFMLIEVIVENNEGGAPDTKFLADWRNEYGLTYPIVRDVAKGFPRYISGYDDWTEFLTNVDLPYVAFVDKRMSVRATANLYDRAAFAAQIEELIDEEF